MNNQDKIHVLSRGLIPDKNKILLCKTLDLKKQFYYLPGGHIEQGESAYNALLRELKEETGFECNISKFLGCLEYSFEPGENSICHNHEYNFVFKASSDFISYHKPIASPESKIGLTWISLEDLSKIDLRPEPFITLIPQWLKIDNSLSFKSEMI